MWMWKIRIESGSMEQIMVKEAQQSPIAELRAGSMHTPSVGVFCPSIDATHVSVVVHLLLLCNHSETNRSMLTLQPMNESTFASKTRLKFRRGSILFSFKKQKQKHHCTVDVIGFS